jgi:hypothetical protein
MNGAAHVGKATVDDASQYSNETMSLCAKLSVRYKDVFRRFADLEIRHRRGLTGQSCSTDDKIDLV